MPRISFNVDLGEAIVYKNKAYRRVGKVKGAATEPGWPDGPNDMYNIFDVNNFGPSNADPSGRRHWSAEETALSFQQMILTTGNRNGVTCVTGIPTLVFSWPALNLKGGVWRFWTTSAFAKADIFIGGVQVWNTGSGDLPNAGGSWIPLIDNGNIAQPGFETTFGNTRAWRVDPGQDVSFTAQGAYTIYSVFLPDTYPV